MNKTVLTFLVLFGIGVIVLYNLLLEVENRVEINRGNQLIENIEKYRNETGELPSSSDWKTLRSIGFTEEETETGYPIFRGINDSTFELIFTIGFDPPYLMWNSNERIWKNDFPTIPEESSLKHCVYSDDTLTPCKCPLQFELKDSLKLTHIKGQFYKSKTGHLYQRTIGQKELNDHLTDHEYYNGYLSQEVDPLTFEPTEGWYAKDKNYVYYYRPVSGGMQLSKIDKADTKTFHLLAGHYSYAQDKNFFFDQPQIIEGFISSQTKLNLDSSGRVIEMISKNDTFKFELVN